MPHSTSSGADRVPSLPRVKTHNEPNGASNGLEKFPEFTESPSPLEPTPQKWLPKRESGHSRPPAVGGPRRNGHGRQKSLSEAIRTIRTRNGSVSQNVHEITDALKAPVSARLIVRISLAFCVPDWPHPA